MNDRNPDAPGAARPEAELFDALPLRWLLLALALWIGLAALLATLQHLQQQVPPAGLVLVSRMRALLGESIIYFLGPVGLLLLIWLLAGPLLRRWDANFTEALTAGLKFGSITFAASAVLWAGLAGWAFTQGNDPWEALPGITPPYLDNFLARHSALSVSTFGGTHWLILHDADGHSVSLDGDDLVDAEVRFQPCPPGVVDAAQLGGIPPYPGAQCSTLLHLRRGGVERVVYAFEVVRDNDLKSIESHFARWAEALGAQHRFQGGPNHYTFEAHKGDSAWDLRLFKVRGSTTAIYIPKDGRTRPWAPKDTAAPMR
jgi:hypothetical protein